MRNRKDIIVTTGDLKRDYKVLGPVYFQVSNKGILSSALSTLKKQYIDEIQSMKSEGLMSADRADWGFLYGEWSVGQNDFEAAFFIATEELKKRAAMVGADAVICMRQDIDLDTNAFAFFYLQMYGTAVKYITDADRALQKKHEEQRRLEEQRRIEEEQKRLEEQQRKEEQRRIEEESKEHEEQLRIEEAVKSELKTVVYLAKLSATSSAKKLLEDLYAKTQYAPLRNIISLPEKQLLSAAEDLLNKL